MKKKTKIAGAVGLSIMVAALLVVGAIAGNDTASAQGAGKTISNLTLSNNDDGDLLINWNAPDLAPNDYRVMWADSDDDYKTWTDNTGNAFPTTASHTVTGLAREQEYKVKVRARYSNSSGPWSAQATHTIPAATPETPATPEPSDAPHGVHSTMPEHVAMFDWSDVEDAVGYELEMLLGSNTEDDWEDITDPNRIAGYNAWMLGSSAIIGMLGEYDHHIRVRAVFEDGTTTDWYQHSARP